MVSKILMAVVSGLLCSSPAIAVAESKKEVMAMQFALQRLGYYDSYGERVDGLSGPSTQAAIKAFATKNKVEAEYWSMAFAIKDKINWRMEWDDRLQLGVDEYLDSALLDYPAARIKEKTAFRWGSSISACLNINAKNSMGAYMGYQWVMVQLTDDKSMFIDSAGKITAIPWLLTTEKDHADLLCKLGYVE